MTQEITISFFLFLAVYFEVFMLLTLFERRKEITSPSPLADTKQPDLLSATIIVPCFNEQETVIKTVDSLLALDYPKNKLCISIVDDGSTDDTWKYIQIYANHPQVKTYQKKNGGKYTALNHGIERATTDLVGCLDADSFVATDTLRKIVNKFQENSEVMAVAPAVKIWQPNNFIRNMQYIEYIYGVLLKKLLGILGAIHVTPGPFSIYRRELFQQVGFFKHAHNTEDMEIAMRMHRANKKIENCHDAFVYTVGPDTFKKLHTQRLRWTYGFLRNAVDYKDLFFNYSKGNIGFLTLPFSVASIVGVLAIAIFFVVSIARLFVKYIQQWQALGFHPSWPSWHYDFFFAPLTTLTFIGLFSICAALFMLIFSQFVAQNRLKTKDVVLYMFVFPFIAMTWVLRSVFNFALAKNTSWR